MIGSKICDYFGYDENKLKEYLNNKKLVNELSFLNHKDNRLIIKMDDNIKSTFDKGYKILIDKRKDLNIDYDSFSRNKIVINGQERKLFKYLNDSSLSEEVGRYKLPNKTLYLVISANPEDMLMCATKQPSWKACTNLDGGDFRFSTIGNLFTNGRFIIYVTDLNKTEFLGLESYSMFCRAFGFVGEDGKLYSQIWYPSRTYIDINNEKFNLLSVKEEHINSKYGMDIVYNNFGIFMYPYLDYCTELDFDSGKFTVVNDYVHFYPKVRFTDGSVESMSKVFWYGGNDNIEKAIKYKCDKCSTKVGHIVTYGKYNFCEDCIKDVKHVCKICEKEKTDCVFSEDNKWICRDCIKENNIQICSECGTTIKMKGKSECRFCRSDRIDAFKNREYEYYDIKSDNCRDYYRHFYVEDKLPPGIKEDEKYSDYEIYVKR